jgi:hypothetical protein
MRDACPPFTGHQREQGARQIVPGSNVMVGSLVGQRVGCHTHSNTSITSGPMHRSTTQPNVRLRYGYFDS